MSSGGIGFSYGTQSVKTTDTGADATQAGSTVGSVNGDLTVRAGDNLTVTGSDLIAGRDMALSGKTSPSPPPKTRAGRPTRWSRKPPA